MAQPAEDPERLVVARIAAGDRSALEELYARHARSLFAYLCRLTPDGGLAEEVLQDTLVAVWTSAVRFAGRSSVQTWLFGIARRQLHNALRRRALHLVDERELAPLHSPEPEPSDRILAEVEADHLAAAIEQLTPPHREIIVLAFIHELPYLDMAEVLTVPIGTVKSRLHSAKRELRGLLEQGELNPW